MGSEPSSLRAGSLPPRALAEAKPRRGSTRIVALMALSIALVALLAWWDGQRESQAALSDFAREQALIAVGAAADLRARVATQDVDAALADLRALERPRELMLFVEPPTLARLLDTHGGVVDAPAVMAALARGDASAVLTRDDAERIGLPARTAVMGLAHVEVPGKGRFGVAVVATARDVRDRERRASLRLVSSVLLAGGLVFAFGSLSLRMQRKELELERELTIAEFGRERDERLVRASRAATMGTLATGVAHEISTPLGVIVGRAEQLLARATAEGGDERAARGARAILEQAERIRDVVRGFLDLGRGGQPTLAVVAPATLVRGAVRLVEHRFEKQNVQLSTSVPDDLPSIHCDVRLMEHALVNLLLNGCEAAESRVRVDVRAEASKIVFAVIDDGPGVSAEVAARATEPFFTTKPAGQGTGLGLAITNEIVKAHRGHLALAAETPKGTRATIELPLAPPVAPEDDTRAA